MNWIAVDWGTTNMRAWHVGQSGEVLDSAQSAKGMGGLNPAEFEPALMEAIAVWLDGPTDVICCGMVGAAQGWAEAPYQPVPAAPGGSGTTRPPVTDPRLKVHILAGMSQQTPPDVMRGEESQIAGFMAKNPGWDGVICLPGTHTKWAEVSAGEVVSFRTFMTGELFGLLSSHSVLRHSVGGTDQDDAAFAEAVETALSHPARLASDLFGIRAASLLQGTSGAQSRATLSGLLIGAELAGAKPYWLGREVALIGAEALCANYATALALQGLQSTTHNATEMTLAGLTAAYYSLKG